MTYKPTHISAAAPTVDNDYGEGYRGGNFWRDTGTPDLLVLLDDTVGAADWETVLSGGVLAEWDDWTPSYTWTGDQPTGVASVARYCLVGDTVWFTLQVSGTAGLGVTGITDMTCTLPEVVADTSAYIPLTSISSEDTPTRWGKGHMGVIDSTSDPRKLAHLCFSAIVSGDIFTLYYSGYYEKI